MCIKARASRGEGSRCCVASREAEPVQTWTGLLCVAGASAEAPQKHVMSTRTAQHGRGSWRHTRPRTRTFSPCATRKDTPLSAQGASRRYCIHTSWNSMVPLRGHDCTVGSDSTCTCSLPAATAGEKERRHHAYVERLRLLFTCTCSLPVPTAEMKHCMPRFLIMTTLCVGVT